MKRRLFGTSVSFSIDANPPGLAKAHYNTSLHDITTLDVFLRKFFSLIQFNVPFKIISLIETSQSIGGAKREYPGKTT